MNDDGTSPFSSSAFGWYIGAEVATRRGKIGTIVAIGDGTVDVKFGGKVFTMKNGQVIHARFARSRVQRQFHGR
jgi:preprotein translocase subunit YajC